MEKILYSTSSTEKSKPSTSFLELKSSNDLITLFDIGQLVLKFQIDS